MDIGPNVLSCDVNNMLSGQTVPQACQVMNEFDTVVPAQTAKVPVRLVIKRGQEMSQAVLAFFQPSAQFCSLGLTICGNPQLELYNRST